MLNRRCIVSIFKRLPTFKVSEIRYQSSYNTGSSNNFFTPPRTQSSSTQHVELSGVEFSKPDGSLQVRFRPPKFSPARAPPLGGTQLYRPALEGIITLRLTPAAAISNNTDGRVTYDWDASVQINLGVLEILHVVQNSIAASVNVQEGQPRGGSQQQQQQQQQRMRLEILPPTSTAASTSNSSTATNNVSSQGQGVSGNGNGATGNGGVNLYRISILSEEGKGVSINVSQAEVYLLRNLLGTSLPWVTGWMYNLDPSALIPGYHLLPPYQPSSQQQQSTHQSNGYTNSLSPSQTQQQPRTSTSSPNTGLSPPPSFSSPMSYNRPASTYNPSSTTSRPSTASSQQASSSNYSRPPYSSRNQ